MHIFTFFKRTLLIATCIFEYIHEAVMGGGLRKKLCK